MEFNNVSKTCFRSQLHQRVPEIYYFSHRNPHKLEILHQNQKPWYLAIAHRSNKTKIKVPFRIIGL